MREIVSVKGIETETGIEIEIEIGTETEMIDFIETGVLQKKGEDQMMSIMNMMITKK